jgi:uncharacterized protein YndB with AHSA1/START domain
MTTAALPYRLDRTLLIRARRETVFSFFTDSSRWASWWGAGSSIDPAPGGAVLIRHPNGVEASGEVVEVRAPERIVFTYGYANGRPAPPGSSRVTITLDDHADGTLLQLTHEFADETARDEHVQGWRFQLSLFANAVANLASAHLARVVAGWFEAWNEPDGPRRDALLAQVTGPTVRFSDRFSCVDGLPDLTAHLAAVHRFMPGVRITPSGEPRHCQWSMLSDWSAAGPDDTPRGRGTNLFMFDADGRIASVTGFWSA